MKTRLTIYSRPSSVAPALHLFVTIPKGGRLEIEDYHIATYGDGDLPLNLFTDKGHYSVTTEKN